MSRIPIRLRYPLLVAVIFGLTYAAICGAVYYGFWYCATKLPPAELLPDPETFQARYEYLMDQMWHTLTLLGAVLGAILLIWRSLIAERHLATAEEQLAAGAEQVKRADRASDLDFLIKTAQEIPNRSYGHSMRQMVAFRYRIILKRQPDLRPIVFDQLKKYSEVTSITAPSNGRHGPRWIGDVAPEKFEEAVTAYLNSDWLKSSREIHLEALFLEMMAEKYGFTRLVQIAEPPFIKIIPSTSS